MKTQRQNRTCFRLLWISLLYTCCRHGPRIYFVTDILIWRSCFPLMIRWLSWEASARAIQLLTLESRVTTSIQKKKTGLTPTVVSFISFLRQFFYSFLRQLFYLLFALHRGLLLRNVCLFRSCLVPCSCICSVLSSFVITSLWEDGIGRMAIL